jgi:hypothetical protein
MGRQTQADDATEEPNAYKFAMAVQDAGVHGGGALRGPSDGSALHVDVTPGCEHEADELAARHGFSLDRVELTRRVYVPEVSD